MNDSFDERKQFFLIRLGFWSNFLISCFPNERNINTHSVVMTGLFIFSPKHVSESFDGTSTRWMKVWTIALVCWGTVRYKIIKCQSVTQVSHFSWSLRPQPWIIKKCMIITSTFLRKYDNSELQQSLTFNLFSPNELLLLQRFLLPSLTKSARV